MVTKPIVTIYSGFVNDNYNILFAVFDSACIDSIGKQKKNQGFYRIKNFGKIFK